MSLTADCMKCSVGKWFGSVEITKVTMCHCWPHRFPATVWVYVVIVGCGCCVVTGCQNTPSYCLKPSSPLLPMLMRYIDVVKTLGTRVSHVFSRLLQGTTWRMDGHLQLLSTPCGTCLYQLPGLHWRVCLELYRLALPLPLFSPLALLSAYPLCSIFSVSS